MEIYDRHRLERHARRIEELRVWRNAHESPVKGWRFVAGDEGGASGRRQGGWPNAHEGPGKGWRFGAGDEGGASGEPHDVEPGDVWPEIGIPVRLSARTSVPEEWAGLPVELELWLGGEGFVEISVEAGA